MMQSTAIASWGSLCGLCALWLLCSPPPGAYAFGVVGSSHTTKSRFPNFANLALDLRARDYTGSGTWPARTGPDAGLQNLGAGKMVFQPPEKGMYSCFH